MSTLDEVRLPVARVRELAEDVARHAIERTKASYERPATAWLDGLLRVWSEKRIELIEQQRNAPTDGGAREIEAVEAHLDRIERLRSRQL
jgi:hypothetical protein